MALHLSASVCTRCDYSIGFTLVLSLSSVQRSKYADPDRDDEPRPYVPEHSLPSTTINAASTSGALTFSVASGPTASASQYHSIFPPFTFTTSRTPPPAEPSHAYFIWRGLEISEAKSLGLDITPALTLLKKDQEKTKAAAAGQTAKPEPLRTPKSASGKKAKPKEKKSAKGKRKRRSGSEDRDGEGDSDDDDRDDEASGQFHHSTTPLLSSFLLLSVVCRGCGLWLVNAVTGSLCPVESSLLV